jgi:hypothetical protein
MKPAEEWAVKLKGQAAFHRRNIVRAIQADATRHCGTRFIALAQGVYQHSAEAMVRELLKEADRLEGK